MLEAGKSFRSRWKMVFSSFFPGNDPDAGKGWRQKEKAVAEDEMVRWHHQLNGHEFEQIPRDSGGQRSLARCSPWGSQRVGHGLAIEQQQKNPQTNMGLSEKCMFLFLDSFYLSIEESTHWKRPWCWERLRAGEGATEEEMVGWHHRLQGHEFEQTLGDSEGQGSLVCCSPWGCKHSDTTEQLNNKLSIKSNLLRDHHLSNLYWAQIQGWLRWPVGNSNFPEGGV